MKTNKLRLEHLFALALFFRACECKGVAIYTGASVAARFRRPSVFKPFGPSNDLNYYTSYNIREASYGIQFGRKGLNSDTHIFNDNYKSYLSGDFLVNRLFKDEQGRSHLGEWTERDDKRWRLTTKAPFFENKIPKSENFLPAAVVGGAATAFGLKTLLPLNVPEQNPLMGCPETDLLQSAIKLDGRTYSCVDSLIQITCSEKDPLMTTSNPNDDDANTEDCVDKTINCNSVEISDENLLCESGILTSISAVVCDSFEIVGDIPITVLNCHYGELPTRLASFVPTTESSIPQTTIKPEEDSSLFGVVKSFFGNILKKVNLGSDEETSVDEATESIFDQMDGNWVPEALPVHM